jgi:hypothetical protein
MNNTTLNMTTLDGGVIIKKGTATAPPSGGGETLYFAAKDGGAMGPMSETSLFSGFAVKSADNTIHSLGLFLVDNDFSAEALTSIKAVAFALGDYTYWNVDFSNPDTLRGIMFQNNGTEGMPEIIEITKEQFYNIE